MTQGFISDRRSAPVAQHLAGPRGYAICTEPRSGSIYLCELLASTGVLGAPTEFFDAETLRARIPDYPTNPQAQLQAIPRLGATPNGVYGVKVFSRHFDFDGVRATQWAERLPRLSFIHLTRLDALGQAISHVRASQTWQWVADLPALGESVYDFDAINAELIRLLSAQTRWAYYLSRNGLPVLHVVYEHMVASPQETVNAVARLVGVREPAVIDFAKVRVTPQRDAITQDWRERFVSHARDLSAFPA
jgi:LPS sulfotransferase NodH